MRSFYPHCSEGSFSLHVMTVLILNLFYFLHFSPVYNLDGTKTVTIIIYSIFYNLITILLCQLIHFFFLSLRVSPYFSPYPVTVFHVGDRKCTHGKGSQASSFKSRDPGLYTAARGYLLGRLFLLKGKSDSLGWTELRS